jgi:LuxR family maltose regulon positive regulatory protein
MLNEWIPNSRHCVTWLSLDSDDNDPTRFWMYFIAALQRLRVDLGENALALFQSPQPPPIPHILAMLINEITDFPENFAIVLDDYHLIKTQSINESLTFLLDHLPPQMRVILATRADPPLPISRLRARDQLNELRADDLRFNLEEATAFLNEVMGLSLSTDNIAALETRTEGWIAGLQLAALSMEGREDVTGFVQNFSGSHRHVLTYLAEEVLDRRPEGTLDFLLKTAILDRLCGSLCDAVTGGNESQVLLQKLEQANLFIVPLDDKAEWYRYHHLFVEVLRARLQQAQPDLIPALHHRASIWFEEKGLWVEAVNHALSGIDYERAARLIEKIGMRAALQGQALAVFGWLNALPEAVLHANPRLCVLYAWLLLSFVDSENAEKYLNIAEKALAAQLSNETSPELQNIHGEMLATKALRAVYQRGFDPTELVSWVEQSLQKLHLDNIPFRSTATGVLGSAYRNQRDWARAEQAYAQAATMERTSQNVMSEFAFVMQQTLIQRLQGKLSLALTTGRQALNWAAEQGVASSPFTGGVYTNLAGLVCERSEFEEAERFARLGVTRSAQTGNPHQHIASILTLARVEQAMGNFEEALESIRQAQELAQQNQAFWFLNLVPAIEIQFHLAQGNLPSALQRLSEAQAKADEWRDFVGGYELVFTYEIGQIAPLQANITQGRRNRDSSLLLQVIAQLEAKLRNEESDALLWYQAKLLILQAIAYNGLDDSSQSSTCLERALILAEPEGYIRIFLDEGQAMADVIVSWRLETGSRKDLNAAQKRLMAYTDKLLEAFPGRSAQPANTHRLVNSPVSHPSLIEPLSARELEVLHLVANGLSNREIANRLFITINTVKKHIRLTFDKLDVSNRTQAVARARELGLL